MESAKDIVIKIACWFLIASGVIGILASTFWLFFYSVDFANLNFIVTTRKWYETTYWNLEALFIQPRNAYPPFLPIYNFHIVQVQKDGNYLYVCNGYLSRWDKTSGLIVITGLDNKPYSFSIPNLETSAGGINIMKNVNNNIVPVVLSADQINQDLLQVAWVDNRSLTTILEDYKNSPNSPINRNSLFIYMSDFGQFK